MAAVKICVDLGAVKDQVDSEQVDQVRRVSGKSEQVRARRRVVFMVLN